MGVEMPQRFCNEALKDSEQSLLLLQFSSCFQGSSGFSPVVICSISVAKSSQSHLE